MAMTLQDVATKRVETAQFRQGAFELLYIATVNNDSVNIQLAKTQLATCVVRDDCLNNIEALIHLLGG